MISWDRVNELRDEVGSEDFEEVTEMFLSEVEEVIGRLRTAPDPTTLESDLHALKGSALNLGFNALSKLCQAGEAKTASGQAARVSLERIFETYAASRQEFAKGLKAG